MVKITINDETKTVFVHQIYAEVLANSTAIKLLQKNGYTIQYEFA